MIHKIRINLANPEELQELPGIGWEQALAIASFRAEHGPITDLDALSRVLHGFTVSDALWQHVDFSPSDGTAPEAPGA